MPWFKRCPCDKCLVEVVCKDPCDDFKNFVVPVDEELELWEKRFMEIEEFLDDTIFETPYEVVGEYFFGPIFYIYMKFKYRLDVKGPRKSAINFATQLPKARSKMESPLYSANTPVAVSSSWKTPTPRLVEIWKTS